MVTLKSQQIFEEIFGRLDRLIGPLDFGPEERYKRLFTVLDQVSQEKTWKRFLILFLRQKKLVRALA